MPRGLPGCHQVWCDGKMALLPLPTSWATLEGVLSSPRLDLRFCPVLGHSSSSRHSSISCWETLKTGKGAISELEGRRGWETPGTLGLHLCRREKYSHKTASCDGPRGSLLRVTHTLVAPGRHAHRTPTARPGDSRHCRECRGPLSSSLCGHFHDRQVEDLLKSVFQHHCFALTACDPLRKSGQVPMPCSGRTGAGFGGGYSLLWMLANHEASDSSSHL